DEWLGHPLALSLSRLDLVDIEAVHAFGDLVERILDGEVAGSQPVHLGLRQIPQVRFASFASEEDVLLAPENDRLGLSLPQERLPFGIQLDVGAVVVKQVELHPLGIWTLHEAPVGFPVVRADKLRVLGSEQVDAFDGVALQKGGQRSLCLSAAILPQGTSESIPGGSKAYFICVRVLNDQPVERLRVAHHNPEADRTTVVLNEEPVMIEAPVL